MNQVNQQLLNSVLGSIQMISHELAKPQEDVVSISVCGSTKRAIENILRLYLESHGVETKLLKNINDLKDACLQQDKSFQHFDFSSVNCRCEPSDDNTMSYCLGEDKINSCYRLLVSLKNFIFKDLKITGK